MSVPHKAPTLYVQGARFKTDEQGMTLRDFTMLIGSNRKQNVRAAIPGLIFFFENLDYLCKHVWGGNSRSATNKAVQYLHAITSVLSTPSNPYVRIVYNNHRWRDITELSLVIEAYEENIILSTEIVALIEHFLKKDNTGRHGNFIFVPPERVAYSHIRPDAIGSELHSNRPSVLLQKFFIDTIRLAEQTFCDNKTYLEVCGDDVFRRLSKAIVSGDICCKDGTLRICGDDSHPINISDASAGQKSSFHIVLLGNVLPVWRSNNLIDENFTLYIEDPEAYLSPDKQIYMAELLTYLSMVGFRVIATTHSLTFLYKINNMLLLSSLDEQTRRMLGDNCLCPKNISAYYINEDGATSSIVMSDPPFISEDYLATTDANLIVEMELIMRAAQEPDAIEKLLGKYKKK